MILGGKWVGNVGKIYNLRKRKCTGVGVFSSYIIYRVCVAFFPGLCKGRRATEGQHEGQLVHATPPMRVVES